MASKKPPIPKFIQAKKDRLKRLVHIHPPHVGTPTPLTKEQIDYIQAIKLKNEDIPQKIPVIPTTDPYEIYYDGQGKFFAVGDIMGKGGFGVAKICWEVPMKLGEVGAWHVFKMQKHSTQSQQEIAALKKLGKLISSFDTTELNYSIQPLVDGNEFYKSVNSELKAMAEHIDKDQNKEHLFEKYSNFIEQCFDMGIEAISGMQELHKQGILHRDIKLENMMWDRDGKIHYIDFGLSSTSYKGEAIVDIAMGTRELRSHSLYNKSAKAEISNTKISYGYTPYDDMFALAASLLSNNIDKNRQPTENGIARIKKREKPVELESAAFNLDKIINLAEKIGASKALVSHAQQIAKGIQAILNGKVDKPNDLPELMNDFKNVMILLKNDIVLKRGLNLFMAAKVKTENTEKMVKKQFQKFISAYISNHPNPSRKTPFSFPYTITDTNATILHGQAAINRLNELILTYPDVLTKEQREAENFKELQDNSEVGILEIGLDLTPANKIPKRLKKFISAYFNDPSSNNLPFSFPYSIKTKAGILHGQAAIDKLNDLILTYSGDLTKEQRESHSFKELQLSSTNNKKLFQDACTIPSRLYPIKEKYYLHAVFDYLKNQKDLNTEKKLFIMIGAYDAVLEEMKSKLAPNKEPDKYYNTILEQRNKIYALIIGLNPNLNQQAIIKHGQSAFLEKINNINLAIQTKDTKGKEIARMTKLMNIPEDAKQYSAQLKQRIMEKSTAPTISRDTNTSKLDN